ncbi:hypothetical protein AAHE18_07G082100 [Arachis hypogaea]
MTKKSAVPNGIGNKATLPPTATKSPPPQVKLVLVVAPGAVVFEGISYQGNHICFGRYALQALEPAWITSRQIEAGRRAMSRNVCRGGQIWVRIFPDKPVTVRPTETRMGSGKGSPEYWVAVVKPGRILYEMGGVAENIAKRAISIATSKMPIQTQFIISR